MSQPVAAPEPIPHVRLDEYGRTFAPYFDLERSESGVLTARMQTDAGPVVWGRAVHRAIHQLIRAAGQDADNEVFIFGGTGDLFVGELHDELVSASVNRLRENVYDDFYYDGSSICEGLVNNFEIPTIGVINGPGFHTELAVLCDITIAAEDAVLFDPHLAVGLVPGDGIQIAFRSAMGYKRANYALLTGQTIDAEQALDYGLVSEVVPNGEVYDRARELADDLAALPRTVRRVTTQVLRAPLRETIARELRGSLGQELFAMLASADPDATPAAALASSLGAERGSD